ncbi:MAG: hypothetical protein OSP8Acid_01960 [uncultured Acidilobus sp. OSP8]|nr:MAG: hypothetical protein OSP8Acid_01960 [uncultured Acidilobus sp. OSP8]
MHGLPSTSSITMKPSGLGTLALRGDQASSTV